MMRRSPGAERAARRRALALALALGLGLWLAPVGQAQSSEPVRIRVEITDDGFNGTPDYTLEVEQGQLVELTFVFAQTHAVGDSHVIVLRGLGLETNEINFYNREATLTFVADRAGSFEMACDLDCEVHRNLQRAHLKVKGAAGAAGGARSAALVATSLTMYPSAWEVAGGPVKLTATLKDANGQPVSKAPVAFYVETAFAGTSGLMEIGAARTDANGTAAISYRPTFTGGQRIASRFEGMGLYGESEQSLQLQVRSTSPAYAVEPRGLEAVSDRAPVAVVLILLSIWSTFGFVLFQVYRIRCAPVIPLQRRLSAS